MREIKFRAWDGLHKHFVYFELGVIDGKMWTTPPVYTDHVLSEWMQDTGLKDKNGKKIWGGDIVQYKEVIPSENNAQRRLQGANYVVLNFVGCVVWDQEGASFDIQGTGDNYRGFGARGNVEIEVIGNIYQNPELLK